MLPITNYQCPILLRQRLRRINWKGNIETGNTGNIGNNPHWVDVEAEGVTPVSAAELTNDTFAGGDSA